eukprot:TRINITY_DN9391_c0_g1_i2.p1 TRINITY_DN9391_c0_g1~~TRINITY_DN9391_c0_g1_i2.p1  ORF type:complete len:747 (+),score=153.09 TRINITY_DN9391_c0_g1_i2:48-2243(+)
MEPIAILHIQAIQGRDLPPKDDNGYSDPYCIIRSGAEQVSTKVIHRSLNPVWEQSFEIPLYEDPLADMVVDVYDKDLVGSDDFMGRVIVNMQQLANCQEIDEWFPLETKSMMDIVSGVIHLIIRLEILDIDWDPVYNSLMALDNGSFNPALRLINDCLRNPALEYWKSNLYLVRSTIFLKLKKYQEAIDDAHTAKDMTKSCQAYFQKAVVYFSVKDYENAEKNFRLVIENEPNYPRANLFLEDIEETRKLVELEELCTDIRDFYRIGNYEEAINECDKLIDKHSKCALYYLYRAFSYTCIREFDKATEDILKVADLETAWIKRTFAKTGELKKKGEVNIKLQKRFFILKDNFLFYYKAATDKLPQGVIIVLHRDVISRKNSTLTINAPQRKFKLKCDSEDVAKEWESVLHKYGYIPQELPLYSELPRSGKRKKLGNRPILRYTAKAGKKIIGLMPKPFRDVSKGVTNATRNVTTTAASVGKSINKIRVTNVDLIHVDAEGFLFKKGEVNSSWKKRYFILKGQNMYYFQKKPTQRTNGLSREKPAGLITLGHGASVYESHDNSEHSLEIIPSYENVVTQKRTYVVKSEDPEDIKFWHERILGAISMYDDQRKSRLANVYETKVKITKPKIVIEEEPEVELEPEPVIEHTPPKKSTESKYFKYIEPTNMQEDNVDNIPNRKETARTALDNYQYSPDKRRGKQEMIHLDNVVREDEPLLGNNKETGICSSCIIL